MATYTINVKLMEAAEEAFPLVVAAMAKGNFIPLAGNGPVESRFSYYGNR
jgi:hypothetical protein